MWFVLTLWDKIKKFPKKNKSISSILLKKLKKIGKQCLFQYWKMTFKTIKTIYNKIKSNRVYMNNRNNCLNLKMNKLILSFNWNNSNLNNQ